jgi:2-polyprenyl-3-methyl-5-hydroxy-6-metoxy-1,4-benzoquinol methylase
MKLKTLLRSCPICHSEDGKVLHNQKFSVPDHYKLPKEYDVVSCVNCNFVYADTDATQADYDDYYEQFSKYEEKSSSGSGTTYLDAVRLEQTATDIDSQLKNPIAKILDIGCGNGGLLSALSRLGYQNLTGMDPSATSTEYIVNNLHFSAIQGGIFTSDLFDVTSEEEKYDCIILSHVMEHIYDLKQSIRNIARLLKQNGFVYVEVPDASRYHEFYVVPYYYFDCEHINHFDEASLGKLMKSAELECVLYKKKDLKVSDELLYPAVFGLYQWNHSSPFSFVDDHAVKNSIHNYCEKSKVESKLFEQLDPLIKLNEPVVVWGAGSYALRVFETTRLKECNLVGFVDKDSKKHGLTIGNIPVYSTDLLRNFRGTIIICSALYSKDIKMEILQMGLVNPVFSLN